jgi:hypothetical protein
MTVNADFKFNLEPVDGLERPLTFEFGIEIFGQIAWPVRGEPDQAIEIQIDDLFAFLVEFWKPLLLRQTYPVGLRPARPSHIWRDAARRWEGQPEGVVEQEAREVAAFEEAQDFSQAFGGLFDLPPFWMLREGNRMICDSGYHLDRVPFNLVCDELTRIGDAIAGQLMQLDADRWDEIVAAWNGRHDSDEASLVAWSASLDREVAETLIDRGLIKPPRSVNEAANDNDELLIAARMAGTLPADQIAEIVDIARSFRKRSAVPLDELSKKCMAYISSQPSTMAPYGQGEDIARVTRDYLGVGPSEPIDIFSLMRELGIEIAWKSVEPSTFDGLAIAGGQFGPGAFLNANSSRIKTKGILELECDPGARVTLAHEFCHLLVDRNHPLSAVEVLRSRMPASIEARAKSFAGEFLLPAITAATLWDQAGAPVVANELEVVLQELADTFGVSFSVAAWKLEHGSGDDRRRLRPVLDVLAPYR